MDPVPRTSGEVLVHRSILFMRWRASVLRSLAGPDPSLSQAFIDAPPLQRHIKTNEKNACFCKYLVTTTIRWEKVLDAFGGRGHPGTTRVKENAASLSRTLVHQELHTFRAIPWPIRPTPIIPTSIIEFRFSSQDTLRLWVAAADARRRRARRRWRRRRRGRLLGDIKTKDRF